MATSQARPGRRARISRRARDRVGDPVFWAEVVQNAKIVVAAVLAWVVAIDLLGLHDPVLAPWSAVLVVHATVYRTFTRGAQQVSATVLAVVLAWVVGQVLGMSAISLGVSLATAFLIGRLPWLREESTTLATTTIVVLGTGYLDESNIVFGRLLDTAVGIGVGLLVNLVVWPPMRDRAASSFLTEIAHEVGDILSEIAAGLGPDMDEEQITQWLRMCRRADVRHDQAWGLVRQARESTRLNPRQRARTARVNELEDVLHGLEQALSEVQSMVRTLALSIEGANIWQEGIRERCARLLESTAEGVACDDPHLLQQVRQDLGDLANDLSTEDLRVTHWQEYGGFIVNLRNVVASMIPVSEWHVQRIRRTEGAVRTRGL